MEHPLASMYLHHYVIPGGFPGSYGHHLHIKGGQAQIGDGMTRFICAIGDCYRVMTESEWLCYAEGVRDGAAGNVILPSFP